MKTESRNAVAAGGAAPAAAPRHRDVRGFWRILLAVIAPLPMLAKAVYYLLTPVDGGTGFRETVAAYAGREPLIQTLTWLDAVFLGLLIPATFAVAWVARRGAPRLATAGALLSLGGFLAGVSVLGGVPGPAYLTVTHGLDLEAMAALSDAYDGEPIALAAGLLFITGIVIGLSVLGVALWRSRVAPAWMGMVLVVGGATHPFLPGHLAQGIGLVAAAVGFAGASVALLRMRNDDFDLPAGTRSAA
jgi:hypothetical protein